MKKAICFLWLLTIACLHNSALCQKQNGSISGTIFSDSSQKPLASATISLINAKDSSIEKMAVSDAKGHFILNDLRLADYNVQITAINYLPLLKHVTLTEQKKEVMFDSLIMQFTSDSLAAVTVVAYRPAVVIKTDTTEFNAGSFKVKENAMVEDLLKKLPGMVILKDGTVQAQGETITQIYVDGKPFFGNDPKMVTQNLPADVIDKIQLIDKKSEQAQVTKVEDGVREKIINITIKKNKNKGYFGRAYVGYGTSERYEGKITANYFNKTSKVSLVAGANNTGRNDYGSGEDENTSYNNYNGVTKDAQAKITYTDKWGKKMDVHADAGYSTNNNISEQIRNRQNIFEDSTNFYFEQNKYSRNRSGVNAGVGFEYKPDTLTTVRLNQSANFGKNTSQGNSIFNTNLTDSKKINEGNRVNNTSSNSPSINGNLSVTHRFRKLRRAMFFNLNNNISSSLTDGFNVSNNYFFPVNSPQYQRLVNQFLNNDSRSTSLNSSISYSEPISKKGTVNFSVAYNFNDNNNIRETFNFNNISGLYDLLNDTLTNNFKNFNYNTSIGANYNYALKKGNISIGTTWQDAKTKSKSITKDSLYLQHFSGLVPYLSMNFYNKQKRFGMNYSFSNRAPQAYQLQPVVDNSNPLYIRLGNPNLKYSTTHRINANFNNYNDKKQTSLYSSASFALITNNITTSTIYDKVTGSQTSIPINVNGVYNGNGNVGYSKPFKILKQSIYWNSNSNLNFGRNVSLINFEKNVNQTFGGRIGTGLSIDIDDLLEAEVKPNISIQSSSFSLKPDQNNTYYTYGCEYSLGVDIGDLTEIRLNGDFNKNTGRSAGFNKNIHIINADVTQYFNTKKTWWVKVKVYDLLKQNLSVYRYSGESYIEDTQNNVLTRFFLVSLNYKLSKLLVRSK